MIQIGAAREHDFGEPLGMLRDCHRRILRFLGVMVAAAEAAVLQEAGAAALVRALDYFQSGGVLHHADEEESLFPCLPGIPALEELGREHAEAARLHQEADRLGRLLAAQGRLGPEQQAAFRAAVRCLAELYPRHLEREEQEIFTAAEQRLTAEEKIRIGKEMAARRGLVR